MFFCALSGEPPQDAVVSSKSGHVYERRLIIKYISENGTDPITGEKLAEEDLVSVKASPSAAPPRPPSLTSVPAILHTLQNEWDALVLEQFSLKQQYNAMRQELSHSLYQYDAATRVVARLMKERDAAREALASVQATMGVAPSQPSGDVEMDDAAASQQSGALPADIDAAIEETHQTLSAIRRKKAKPAATYASAAQLANFTSKHVVSSLHSASPAGITSLAVSSANPSQFLTGGNDKIVQLYDRSSDKVLASLKGHTKKVNHVVLREKSEDPTLLISGSADKTVRVWGYDAASGEYAPNHTVKIHKGEISGVSVHPTSTILAVSSLDKTYSLHSLSTFQAIYQSPVADDPYTSLSIHPDGILLALGTSNSTVHVYDVRSGQMAVSLTPDQVEGSTPFSVHTSSFSENGYHFASPTSNSTVAIWDLRKPKITATIPVGDVDTPFNINRVKYDVSSQFLGVSGSAGIKLFANKTWKPVVGFEDAGDVVDFAWGPEAKEIWGAVGREVRIWAEADQ